MKVYVIFDNQKQAFWFAGAKGAWLKPGSAKNAVLNQIGVMPRDDVARHAKHFAKGELNRDWLESTQWERRYLTFADQTRFTCLEYELEKSSGKVK